MQNPGIKRLKGIRIKTVPSNTGTTVVPCVEIRDGRDYKLIWTNNPKYQMTGMFASVAYTANKNSQMWIPTSDEKHKRGVDLCGDLFFKLINTENGKLICRFAINTAFVKNNYYTLTKSTVDPDSIKKSKKFSNDFKVRLEFEDVCTVCDSSKPMDQLCQGCYTRMDKEFN